MTVDQNWMLDEVTVVRGVRHAVVLSADGLVRTHSAQTSKDDMQALRRSIDATPEASSALRAQGLSSAAVIAALVDDEGKLTLVTNDET